MKLDQFKRKQPMACDEDGALESELELNPMPWSCILDLRLRLGPLSAGT